MTTKHDNQQRAADFLRQWQEQMTRQMSNPDAIRAMLEAMQHFGKSDHDANARRPTDAPDARHDAIRNLTERVHTLEQQLRQLHARLDAAEKPARTGKRANAKPVQGRKRTVANHQPGNAKPVAKRKPAVRAKPVAKRAGKSKRSK